ncbi:hypothetical protein ADK35_08025 [Streptomyces viridochromogenes]|uniref:hypothetical protein n=1 Tax=Streptomyces viridochromogenes TaxID=1938 RepID=UPI00069D442E|nr:hypothetical protein [Streptomyces viridochromogenes]KOG25962.1 hypothetical protein ADK35_08025 [Streptomyces viridochromogenes]
MTAITDSDLRRWQFAAINVLSAITDDARDLPPITWKVATTAQLQGEPGSGTRSERMTALGAWADHLGIALEERPGSDGLVTYYGHTERTAKNGKSVTVSLYMRVWPDED